ncbi:hypothetical protein REMIM1_PE00304 (plasmid) [Rhizobium etli bv. mimosae str. Mim1]|nr:hypothetical protein REMIM1_PE00304 [Rhizobium etli bv. mimosae str. Mim1]
MAAAGRCGLERHFQSGELLSTPAWPPRIVITPFLSDFGAKRYREKLVVPWRG